MPHTRLIKGSHEAKAWAQRMQAARQKKSRNPGARWHDGMAQTAQRYRRTSTEPLEQAMYGGIEVAHRDSAGAARRLGMNSRKARITARPTSKLQPLESMDIDLPGVTYTVTHLKRKFGGGYEVRWATDTNDGIVGVFDTIKQATASTRGHYQGFDVKDWPSARPASRHPQRNPLAVFSLGNPPQSVKANVKGIIYNRCLEIRAEKTKYQRGLYRHPFSRKAQVQILALDSGDLLVHSATGTKLWGPI